jgi:ADP-ribosylglycohydrolase
MFNQNVERYIGALVGGCCGDVLGSQTEGMTRAQIVTKFGGNVTEMPSGKKYTDDTEMTIILARHIATNKDIAFSELHEEYGKGMTDKGYSTQTRNILTLCRDGNTWHQKGTSDHNGAIMRIVPCGLIPHTDDACLVQQLEKALYMTHAGSSDAMASAFIHCKLIRALVTNRFDSKLKLFSYMMCKAIIYPSLFAKLNLIKYCLNTSPPIESITSEIYGNPDYFQIKAIDCLCCAVYTFFRFYDHPVEAVSYAASMGGDTDTIAKIVGDLCGALHGTKWIPQNWRGVEGESELIELGKKLSSV